MTADIGLAHRAEFGGRPPGRPSSLWRSAGALWLLAGLIFFAAGLMSAGSSPFSWIHPREVDNVPVYSNADRVSESKAAPIEGTGSSSPVHQIYADTAMGPASYSEEGRCLDRIRVIAENISSSHRLVVNPRPSGIYYVGFDHQDDTYVLRCFKIGQTDYRLFISAAGTDRQEVAFGLQTLFAAASEQTE